MTTRLTHRPSAFTIDGAMTLRVHRAGWLRSPDGRAWLTRSHGGGDMILACDAWHWVAPGSRWVLEPLHPRALRGRPLRIEWRPLPSWRASWSFAWRAFVERLSGQAAFDDAPVGVWAKAPPAPCR